MQEITGVDGGWFQWILSAAAAAGAFFLRGLHGRITEVKKSGEDDRDKLWLSHNEATKDFNTFRDRMLSEMASKSDLREMESRLMSAIRSGS